VAYLQKQIQDIAHTQVAYVEKKLANQWIDVQKIEQLKEGGFFRTQWSAELSVRAGLKLDAKLTQELSVRLDKGTYQMFIGADFLRRAGVSHALSSMFKLDGAMGMDQLVKVELKFKQEDKQSMIDLIQHLSGMLVRSLFHMDAVTAQEQDTQRVFLSHLSAFEIGNAFHSQGAEKAEIKNKIAQKYGVQCNVYYTFRIELKDGEPTGIVTKRIKIAMEKQNNIALTPLSAVEKKEHLLAHNLATLGASDCLNYTQDEVLDLSSSYQKGSGLLRMIELIPQLFVQTGQNKPGKLSVLHYDALAGSSKGKEIKADITRDMPLEELLVMLAKVSLTQDINYQGNDFTMFENIKRIKIKGQGDVATFAAPVIANQKPFELQKFDLLILPEPEQE